MRLKDWVSNNRTVYSGDLVVKILAGRDYKTDDIVFETIASIDVCSEVFGTFDLMKFGVFDRPGGNGATIGVFLWPKYE